MMPIYYTREEKYQLAIARGILVDPEDEWLLEEYTWHLGPYGHPMTNLPRDEQGRRSSGVFLHHMIMGYPIWEGEEIDHINRNPQDNRRYNLRYASVSQNRINSNRVIGVARNVYIREGRYVVRIRRNLVEHYLGAFDTLDEAVAERDEWIYQHEEYVSSTI